MTSAGLEGAHIRSAGETLVGGLYRAAGESPRPAVLLLHGLPGHEKNLDLAIALRDRGFHTLYVHYRGSWGSSGTFSCANLVADAAAAFDWLAQREAVRSHGIAVVGFSLGGWTAMALAAQRSVAAVVAISPPVDSRHVPLPADLAAESAAALRGTTAERLTDEWASLPPATTFADALRSRPGLLVTGDHDPLFPPRHFAPLVQAIPSLRHVRFPRADHAFSDVRPGLRHVVARWLLDVFGP